MQKHTCIYSQVSPHHALSLNEIGAVPGGAFNAFWDPVYRISISTKKKRIHCVEHKWLNLIHRLLRRDLEYAHDLMVLHSLCWSIKIGAAPNDATESTKSKQLYLYR